MKTYKAFTDYFGDVEEVTVLSYDNDRRATVMRSDGTTDDIKTGYICKDAGLTKLYSRMVWHCLGGGTRKTFVARNRKTSYFVYKHGVIDRTFDTKKQAVKYASQQAILHKVEIEVGQRTVSECRRIFYVYGAVEICCDENGYVWQFGPGRQPRRNIGKYLKGYGKMPYGNNKMPRFRSGERA